MTNEQILQKALEVYPPEYEQEDYDKYLSMQEKEQYQEPYIKALQEIESLPKVHGWIARDKDGLLGFYSDKPQRFDDKAWWCDPGCYTALALPPESYPEITWESEPIEVELIIRKS
jgi:hypothetical protein